MDDDSIIQLYFNRSEAAISETSAKYGPYCYSIAYHILADREDSEESVNDTYLAAWNTMPPRHPEVLATFLGKLTRHISLDRWKRRSAQKRGGGQMDLALEELEECVSGGQTPEGVYQQQELRRSIAAFVRALPPVQQKVFVCRYWYLDSSQEIGRRFGFSESKVRSMLLRQRKKLKAHLEKEGLL